MRAMTPADLLRLMRECGGLEGDPGTGAVDEAFDTLGCDSIALLEVVGRIQRDYGVNLVDDVLAAVETPAALMELANSAIRDAAPGTV